ncbi:MAG: YbjQ family protein [Candidatus Neomarinimicrobiota bacterium]|nr:MAG: YbjQ family protein [Candidatus Neomarinimicrobiota bacterium]
MILVNTESIPGKRIQALGLVKGHFVQSKNVGRDIMSGLKSLVGGELKAYSEMLQESRERATAKMVAEAETLGADAIVNVRYMSSQVMTGAAEVMVYGTAVKVVGDE